MHPAKEQTSATTGSRTRVQPHTHLHGPVRAAPALVTEPLLEIVKVPASPTPPPSPRTQGQDTRSTSCTPAHNGVDMGGRNTKHHAPHGGGGVEGAFTHMYGPCTMCCTPPATFELGRSGPTCTSRSTPAYLSSLTHKRRQPSRTSSPPIKTGIPGGGGGTRVRVE